MIEREELINDLALVLNFHAFRNWGPVCSCGWHGRVKNPYTAYTLHVAEQLAQCIERVVL